MAKQGAPNARLWVPPTLTRIDEVEKPRGGTNPSFLEQTYSQGQYQYFVS